MKYLVLRLNKIRDRKNNFINVLVVFIEEFKDSIYLMKWDIKYEMIKDYINWKIV